MRYLRCEILSSGFVTITNRESRITFCCTSLVTTTISDSVKLVLDLPFPCNSPISFTAAHNKTQTRSLCHFSRPTRLVHGLPFSGYADPFPRHIASHAQPCSAILSAFALRHHSSLPSQLCRLTSITLPVALLPLSISRRPKNTARRSFAWLLICAYSLLSRSSHQVGHIFASHPVTQLIIAFLTHHPDTHCQP